MLRAVFRVLRRGGRVVLRNLSPQECADWLYYAYFPEAHAIDLADFWPPEAVVAVLEATGFVAVTVERQHLRYAQNLRVWLDTVAGVLSQPVHICVKDRGLAWLI